MEDLAAVGIGILGGFALGIIFSDPLLKLSKSLLKKAEKNETTKKV